MVSKPAKRRCTWNFIFIFKKALLSEFYPIRNARTTSRSKSVSTTLSSGIGLSDMITMGQWMGDKKQVKTNEKGRGN